MDPSRRRLQITIRGVLLLMVVIAAAFGWHVSKRNANKLIADLSLRLEYAKAELEGIKSRNDLLNRSRTRRPDRSSLLKDIQLSGVNLRGVTISAGDQAFLYASFNESDLSESSLSGGTSAFAAAQFNNANLAGATLTGGTSSFQFASFENADLSGAILTGGGSSFQVSTFEGAKLIGARIDGSFQSVNINGTQFQGADLSMIDQFSLDTCYFQIPPQYDEKTLFPVGFDPAAKGWKLVKASEK